MILARRIEDGERDRSLNSELADEEGIGVGGSLFSALNAREAYRAIVRDEEGSL